MYRCKYVHRVTGDVYWRTVHADTEGEAAKLADRYERKGYLRVTMTRELFNG